MNIQQLAAKFAAQLEEKQEVLNWVLKQLTEPGKKIKSPGGYIIERTEPTMGEVGSAWNPKQAVCEYEVLTPRSKTHRFATVYGAVDFVFKMTKATTGK